MTFPAGVNPLRAADLPLGRRLCRSWILLFGLLPIDYDDLTLLRWRPGVEFLEVSPMLSQRGGSTTACWPRCPAAARA
jgi:hypothetical protein